MYYSKEHEWVSVDGDCATVGITSYAAHQLGDVVYVELPDVGCVFLAGDAFAVVESVKAASDVYSPIDGEILEINEELEGSPELVSTDADTAGWFVKMTLKDPSQLEFLMSKEEYEAFIS